MKNLMKLVLLSSVLSLAACGGGSGGDTDGSNTGGTGGTGDTGSYVSGVFKNASETGDFFNKKHSTYSADQHGSLAESCIVENDYYFESDLVQVYGSRGLPESDYKKIATWVQTAFNSAAVKMDTSFDEVMNSRRGLVDWADSLARAAVALQIVDGVNYPSDFSSKDFSEKELFAHKYIAHASYKDKLLAARKYLDANNISGKDVEIGYGKKIRVCLHNNTSSFRYGEGVFNGMNIAAPSVRVANDYAKIFEHEMIHMIQLALAHSKNPNIMSRWFTEGQAVYLSGQEIAAHKDHYTVDVPSYVFAPDESGRDPSELYKHYGLAYKYLEEANGKDAIMKMIAELKNYVNLSTQLPSGYVFTGRDVNEFVLAWDKTGLKSKDGEALTLNRWVNEYHLIMDKN